MDKSKVSRAATRLEKSGHITKETNADDRRLLKLALTQKGHDLMLQIIPLANQFENKLSKRLGARSARDDSRTITPNQLSPLTYPPCEANLCPTGTIRYAMTAWSSTRQAGPAVPLPRRQREVAVLAARAERPQEAGIRVVFGV